jgi:hypothetical protein
MQAPIITGNPQPDWTVGGNPGLKSEFTLSESQLLWPSHRLKPQPVHGKQVGVYEGCYSPYAVDENPLVVLLPVRSIVHSNQLCF